MTNGDGSAAKSEPAKPLQSDEDCERIKRLEDTILKGAGSLARFKKTIPILLRQAINHASGQSLIRVASGRRRRRRLFSGHSAEGAGAFRPLTLTPE